MDMEIKTQDLLNYPKVKKLAYYSIKAFSNIYTKIV